MLNFLKNSGVLNDSAKPNSQLPGIGNELRQKANKAGLIVTEELDIAITRCKKRVEKLAAECRRGNRKFRDIEFDFLEDKNRCLHGLSDKKKFVPSDARRVTQIFENPQFFVDGATASDIGQGMAGDCWFLSALAVIATAGLVEKMCVARDEQVGIYGFIFWRDSGWVDVIIDDLLFTKSPKWEHLTPREQMLYHMDRDRYNHSSRKGSKILYFARSQTENETWVPLVEKAYAKLHGDYASLDGGFTNEAVEDLTGGVSTLLYVQDILDTDAFWRDELMRANEDRLFACFIPEPTGSDSDFGSMPIMTLSTNGLITGHAYSIIKATEFRGKRFIRIRNPWGKAEWTGRWSDGSREWTKEWLDALEELEYKFDNDGEFVMEYCDFLDTWEIVEKSLLFGEDWVLSSQWLKVNAGDFPKPWNYGDVSYTISVSKPTRAVIVLAQLDTRYFEELASPFRWSLDFAIYKRNEDEAVASSVHSSLWERSVNAEIDLDTGEYVVQVRLDRSLRRPKSYFQDNMATWNDRKLSRKQVEYALSNSIAASASFI
ncbi:hypothetical protein FRC03_008689 [Tulasnella sp. 419]|nr:hypothetical protein FRC03_008689 [Tulasnella sp. 419]